jgi:pilus assembly protein Flp/PilA
MQMFRRFLSDRKGATAIEYGLIASILAVAIIGGFGALSNQLKNVFEAAKDAMANL